jgi:hypothetical protein
MITENQKINEAQAKILTYDMIKSEVEHKDDMWLECVKWMSTHLVKLLTGLTPREAVSMLYKNGYSLITQDIIDIINKE